MKRTSKLSKLERFIYHDLVQAYYVQEGPFPTIEDVRRTADPRNAAEREAMEYVVAKFFPYVEGHGYTHDRCDEELQKYFAKKPAADKRKENGRERQDRAR